jgi:hypothetical protein
VPKRGEASAGTVSRLRKGRDNAHRLRLNIRLPAAVESGSHSARAWLLKN